MSVYKFSEVKKPSSSRTAAVQRTAASKIITAAKARQSIIADINTRADKLSRAFTAKRQFSASDLHKIIAGIETLGRTALRAQSGTFGHLRTALFTNLATDRLVAQAEDLATIRNKLALLRTVARVTLAADEDGNALLQIDDSGFVMDGGDDVMDSLPDAPEADPDAQASVARRAANRHRRADIDDQMSLDEEGLDGQPVGVPDESTPKSGSEPEVDNLPPGTLGPTTQSASEEDLDGQPVGVPDPAGDSNGAGSAGYSKTDPGTTAPSTTLSSRKRRAGPVADGADLPDFLQDDGDDDSTTSARRQARQRRADDDNFNPPNGQDLDNDTVAARRAAQARRRRADSNDNAGDGAVEYSKTDPLTEAPSSTVARRQRRADGSMPPVDPSQLPPVDPTQDPMLSQTSDMDDGLGDNDGMPNDDDGRDIDSAFGDDDDGTQFPGDDDLMNTGADGDDDQGGDDGIELPDDGFDDAIAGEIFSDADFSLGDGTDPDDAAPPVDPTQLTARARQVRRASAEKGGSRTASAAAPTDALKAMISQDFFS